MLACQTAEKKSCMKTSKGQMRLLYGREVPQAVVDYSVVESWTDQNCKKHRTVFQSALNF